MRAENGSNIRSYEVYLVPKNPNNTALPHRIKEINVYVEADNLAQACEKVEVYYSSVLGAALITRAVWETDREIEPMNPEDNE